MKTNNGNLPAAPTIYADMAANGQRELYCTEVGLTKREMFAMHFAGHIWTQYQNDGTAVQYGNWREGVCVESISLADQLLAELEETK